MIDLYFHHAERAQGFHHVEVGLSYNVHKIDITKMSNLHPSI